MKKLLVFLFVFLCSYFLWAQNRLTVLEQKLTSLANSSVPTLHDTADFSVTNVSIQEFLRGLAKAHQLNISTPTDLNIKIYNNFTNAQVKNILLFLCEEYDLDIRFNGTIMSFFLFEKPLPPQKIIPKKEIIVAYDSNKDFISLDLKEDTLFEVCKAITKSSQYNFAFDGKIDKNQKISAFIKNAPFEEGIKSLLSTNELTVEKNELGTFIIRIKEVDNTDPKKNNKGKKGPSNYSSSSNQQQSGDLQLDIKDSLITLEAINMPVADLIKEVSMAMNENYFLFSEPKGTITSALKNVKYSDFLMYVLRGTDHGYKKENRLYLIGENKLEGLRRTKVIPIEYRSLAEIEGLIPAQLKKGVELKEFKELNSLVVTGSSSQIQEIENIIHQVDKVVPMVMIEVIMVDIRRGHTTSSGLKAGRGGDSTSSLTLLPGLDILLNSKGINDIIAPLNIGKVKSDFYLNLSLLERQNLAKIKSMPKLSTLNGHEASMKIGETKNYLVETQNVQGSLNTNTIITRQAKSANADFAIKIVPVISGDEYVTLKIDFEDTGFTNLPQANLPPDTKTSQFTSMIRVKNEEMVLLGGMEKIIQTEDGEGTPLISRIPIIKWLFSKRTRTKSKSVFVIFIKPTIIH